MAVRQNLNLFLSVKWPSRTSRPLGLLLILLDYVSKSKVVHLPPVWQLSLYLIRGFLSNFICCFPWAIPSHVWVLEKKVCFLFIYFLRISIFRSRSHGTQCEGKFQSPNPPTNQKKVCKRVLNFTPKLSSNNWGFLKCWVCWFLTILFSKISNSPLFPMEKPKNHLYGKQVIIEQNGVQFGTHGYWRYIYNVLVTFKVILGSLGAFAIFVMRPNDKRYEKTFCMAITDKRWEIDTQLLNISIGNHIWSVKWHHHIWSWVTLLLLNINKKAYVGSPLMWLNLTSVKQLP